jgi:hypothetical protein
MLQRTIKKKMMLLSAVVYSMVPYSVLLDISTTSGNIEIRLEEVWK